MKTREFPSRKMKFEFTLFVNANDSKTTVDAFINGEIKLLFPINTIAQGNFLFDYTPTFRYVRNFATRQNSLQTVAVFGELKVRVREKIVEQKTN